MNRFHIYSIYNKKGKLCCEIQYKFNILVSVPLEYINTNYTLLASSSATSVKGTEDRSDRNMKAAMKEDDKSGKKKLYKNLIYNEFTFTYTSWYIEKHGKIYQKYSPNILRYMNVYEYIQYIYDMS